MSRAPTEEELAQLEQRGEVYRLAAKVAQLGEWQRLPGFVRRWAERWRKAFIKGAVYTEAALILGRVLRRVEAERGGRN